jgi:tetratricopeptide (TPR) repeat protein
MDHRLRQLIALGREHYAAGEYDKAEQYLAQVVTEQRGFADVFNMLGVIFHSQGRFAEAEEAFEKALDINPRQVPQGARGLCDRDAALARAAQAPRSIRARQAGQHARRAG